MTLIQPNLTSNLPAVSRVDIVARQNPALKRAVRVYTETTRTRSMEEAMLEAMAKPDAEIAPTDDVRSAMAAKDVLDALDQPATARQVADRLGKSEANVLRVLNRLQTQSRVDVAGTTKTKARIWTRTAGAYHEQAGTATAHAAKTEKTRRRALMLIARPATANHVASLLGHSREYTFRVLRTLVDEGLATYDRDGKNAGLFHAVAK